MSNIPTPTIKDVARAAGVSIATVSYVLNDKASAVSEQTRRRVLDAVAQLGYTRNITARNLRANRTRLIGYAWMEVEGTHTNTILEHFAYYLAREAWAAGYHLLTFTYPKDDPVPAYDELVRTGRVDAFVVANTYFEDARIRYFMDRNVPFVSFGRVHTEWHEWQFSWVDTDNLLGMYEAVRYLIQLGHRKIAMVTWLQDSLIGNLRLAGYEKAMNEAGIDINPAYIVRSVYGEDVGERVFAQFDPLTPEEQPTAIAAASDMTAVSVMSAAERRGHVIGKTMSVIGFDDEPMSQYLRPSLTTLRQPIPDISCEVIAMVNERLNGSREVRQVLMPPHLIIRDSTGSQS
jgi:DNA-binding LacI/PurR family transcriptional regulator